MSSFLMRSAIGAALWAALLASPLARAQAQEEPRRHDYPTSIRVEYVQECINLNGGAFALLYQCSCALDRLAETFDPDEFVEAATFVKYATLGGERGGEFRDPDRARDLTRRFRAAQSQAYKACNVQSVARAR